MATLRDIKRRITAIRSTRQITKAMKMVAAAKLRKAQSRMLELRLYAERMNAVLLSIANGADRETHPLLAFRPRKTVEFVIFSSDRGLCGAFNSNILKIATRLIDERKKEGFEVSISVIGKKALDYFKRRSIGLRNSWVGVSTYTDAQEIAHDIIDNYLNETIDEVFLIYNEFKTVMVQNVKVAKLLPFTPSEEGAGEEVQDDSTVFLYEPSRQQIFDQIIPKNIEVQVFRALLESRASEEAARMTTMENATRNADEMLDKLTLQYNKARQAGITKELMDIVGGVEALK